MVKVGKTVIELKTEAELFYNKVEINLHLTQRLDDKLAGVLTNSKRAFYQELRNKTKEIIIEEPKSLENRILILHPLYEAIIIEEIALLPQPTTKRQRKAISKELKDEVLAVFGYAEFTTFNDGKWAYAHSEKLEVNICPYCNMQYAFTIQTARGRTRPQFDHFLNKSKHPYFSMSFFNLIPSCYNCNSSFKGNRPFLLSTHIHPFMEGIQDTLLFRTDINKVDYLMGKKNFKITLKPKIGANNNKLIRAKKSCEIFHIEEQYLLHKEYAGELINKAYMYNDTKIIELMKGFHPTLFKDEEEVLLTLFGNYIAEDKLHKRVLSKLTCDILDEVGIKI